MTLADTQCEVFDADIVASVIFAGFTHEEVRRVTSCLGVRSLTFGRSEVLVREGESAHAVGLVLEGTVLSSQTDADGARHLMEIVEVGEVYGEDLLRDSDRRTHRTITAASPGRVLLIGMDRIVDSNGPLCELRSRVVENLFKVMTNKNRKLESHLRMVSQRSLRSRVTHFLAEQAERNGSSTFMVSVNRAQLADHLNADRAALSRELSRMRSEGLIDYYRSSFRILGSHRSGSRSR